MADAPRTTAPIIGKRGTLGDYVGRLFRRMSQEVLS